MSGNTKQDAQGKPVSYKDTLNLPHTDFPIRAQVKVDDPVMINRWNTEQLSVKTVTHNAGNKSYILHDGPPYANGHIHIGHAYNKILKDIVAKSQRMQGKYVPVTPGWDCHGLPIELKVSQETQERDPVALKKACRVYANKWIDVQKDEFKKLGVLMDWNNPYLTMSYEYESKILQAFGQFVAGGYVERKNKTVPWCKSCQTVLASAEIEHQERKDPSIYVLFPLAAEIVDELFPSLSGKVVNFLVWTTTPWTLPLNRAVLLRPNSQYVVTKIKNTYVITAQQLALKVAQLVDDAAPEILATFNSQQLCDVGAQAHHPFIEGLLVPVLLDQSVLVQDGTACVHSAPGCGPEDYEVGVKNNLEIFSPISPDGKYTAGIDPKELEGMPVGDGQIWVLKKLVAENKLFHKTNIRHSYPHCWRCHEGLIFRATKQWFCDLSQQGLKESALKAIENITFIPEKSVNRLSASISGRLEWCLSRQRVWGVPIAALLCNGCDYTYVTKELIDLVSRGVAQNGIEYWDSCSIENLLPANFVCPTCKGTAFIKETDILDVWFDSGVSHYAALADKEQVGYPVDLYLEGKDQHRGWFQSSLLTGMVINDAAPMRTILTHGFTVDGQGRKMSKSLGNVVSPQELIDILGVDGLRLWVTSIDSSSDAVVSDVLLKNVSQVFRKIRNTARFLLSNLYDFSPERDMVSFESLSPIDRYALYKVLYLNNVIIKGYNDLDFTHIFHELTDYCTVELSSFYLDVIKDRLYVAQADGHDRRSAQTVCWYILDTLTRLCAPILSITAEQIADHYQKNKTDSIHLQSFADLKEIKDHIISQGMRVADQDDTTVTVATDVYLQEHEAQWVRLKLVRSALLKGIEVLREAGTVKHSLEAHLTLFFDVNVYESLGYIWKELEKSGHTAEQFFKELMIVSGCTVAVSPADLTESSEVPGLFLTVTPASGVKCPRCWHWSQSGHADGLCERCSLIVG